MTKIIAWGQRVNRASSLQPPGNSIRLIDAAYGLGFDGIELDVQLSKDDILVLMHDNMIDATTNATGAVNQFTADELSKIAIKDPWNGPTSYIETLESALRRNGTRGLVMVDMHHTVPKTVSAVKRSVDSSSFDPSRLILLSYTQEGGLLYKKAFPEAVVLLKARHDYLPPVLNTGFLSATEGLDGVLVPIARFKDEIAEFRAETAKRGLKLAVFMHDAGLDSLLSIMEADVDYVTSFAPEVFGAARDKFPS